MRSSASSSRLSSTINLSVRQLQNESHHRCMYTCIIIHVCGACLQVVSCLEECPDLRLGTMTADDIADMQAAVAAPKDKAAEEAEDEASAQVYLFIYAACHMHQHHWSAILSQEGLH